MILTMSHGYLCETGILLLAMSRYNLKLLPSVCKYAMYGKKEGTLLSLVHEAAEEKAHGASGGDLSSSGART